MVSHFREMGRIFFLIGHLYAASLVDGESWNQLLRIGDVENNESLFQLYGILQKKIWTSL